MFVAQRELPKSSTVGCHRNSDHTRVGDGPSKCRMWPKYQNRQPKSIDTPYSRRHYGAFLACSSPRKYDHVPTIECCEACKIHGDTSAPSRSTNTQTCTCCTQHTVATATDKTSEISKFSISTDFRQWTGRRKNACESTLKGR